MGWMVVYQVKKPMPWFGLYLYLSLSLSRDLSLYLSLFGLLSLSRVGGLFRDRRLSLGLDVSLLGWTSGTGRHSLRLARSVS